MSFGFSHRIAFQCLKYSGALRTCKTTGEAIPRLWTEFYFGSSSLFVSRKLSTSPALFAGHSHWKNIKATKEANDNAGQMIVQNLSRSIRYCIKTTGNADPKYNVQLARLIEQGKAQNVPNESIQKMLAGASAEKNEVAQFDLKGPGGAMMIIEIPTSSANRTKSEFRGFCKKFPVQILDKSASQGFRFNFEEKGVVKAGILKGKESIDALEEEAIDVGAEEVAEGSTDDEAVFICDPLDVAKVTKALEKKGYMINDSGVELLPKQMITLNDAAQEEINKFLDKLEEHPDGPKVYRNFV